MKKEITMEICITGRNKCGRKSNSNDGLFYQHGRIVRVLESHSMTIMDLAKKCGWSYQNLRGYINFRSNTRENNAKLYRALKDLDPKISFDEVFPKDYDRVKYTLFPKPRTLYNPPEDCLLYVDPDTIAVQDDSILQLEDKLELEKLNLKKRLSDIEYFIITNYKEMSLKELASLYGKSETAIVLAVKRIRKILLEKGPYGLYWHSGDAVGEVTEKQEKPKPPPKISSRRLPDGRPKMFYRRGRARLNPVWREMLKSQLRKKVTFNFAG